MKSLSIVAVCGVLTLGASTGDVTASESSGDSLIVASQTVAAGTSEVEIRIRLTNSIEARTVVVPLEVRSLEPGYLPVTARLSFDDRLDRYLTAIQLTSQYAEKDGTCYSSGAPAFWVPVSTETGETVEISGDPWGLLFFAIAFSPDQHIPPGADSIGSFVITFGLSENPGAFTIDTTCSAPDNHLEYVTFIGSELIVKPLVFTPGLVTVSPCDCGFHGDLNGSGAIGAADMTLLVNWIFFSVGPPPTDPGCPHVDRGDFNCDGMDNTIDLSLMIDHVNYGGAGPCNPCACDPYPSNCP